MPLPDLTADRIRSIPAAEPDPALPHSGREHWRRPYRPGPWRVGTAAVLLLISSFMLLSTLLVAAFGPLTAAALCVAGTTVVLAVAVRLLRVGVWVSASGLRQTGLCHTVTLRWDEISAVGIAQRPVKWLGLPRSSQGQALRVVRAADGRSLRAVLTDHSADFLARPEAFELAADVIEAWAAEHGVKPR